MRERRRSIFGPLALIVLGVALLAQNLLESYSLWTPLLDHWPWILVAWGGVHLAQQLIARANGEAGPPALGAGAVLIALLICLIGVAGRRIRDNDGVVFRGLGVRVQLRDPAFRSAPRDSLSSPPASHESP